MKILVCISVVPDTTSKITIDQSSSLINYDGLTFIVGPYDDYALSRALEIKEINQAEVVILHVGNAESEPLIRISKVSSTVMMRSDCDTWSSSAQSKVVFPAWVAPETKMFFPARICFARN
jgi:hypothetical protein